MTQRPRILTVLEHYLPGVKAGGPVRSIQNLVACLGDDFQFDILTADRDLGDRQPYMGILLRTWYSCDKARVRYLRPKERTFRGWRRVLRAERADLLYLNSLFARSTIRILLLRRLRLVPRVPVIVAPRGELKSTALSLNSRRKASWLTISGQLRLYDGVSWQAATAEEKGDILGALRRLGVDGARVEVAQHLTAVTRVKDHLRTVEQRPSPREEARVKEPGYAKVAFVSRICRTKNLDYALRVLTHVAGRVDFDIYGPMEDMKYWRECLAVAAELPSSVSARYCGLLPHDAVPGTLARYHLLLLPTRGESFGHVVVESLLAGCPVAVSDRTPWRQLAQSHAGWDLPLEEPDRFAEAVSEVVGMDAARLEVFRAGAVRAGALQAGAGAAVEANMRLFLEAMASGRAGQHNKNEMPLTQS